MKKMQQITLSEAVNEGAGDRDDADISLPLDINESSLSLN